MRQSLRCLSVASTAVTLQGIGTMIAGCTQLEYVDVSSCGVVPERNYPLRAVIVSFEHRPVSFYIEALHFCDHCLRSLSTGAGIAEVLPTRTPPDGWEDEADERWRETYPALSTIICRNAPGPVVETLRQLAPWIRINPPGQEKTPLDACALRAEILCPLCLWVRPQPAQVVARRAVEAQKRAEQERAQGEWGPGELTAAQKLLAAIEHAESISGGQRYGEEPDREGAVYLTRYDAGQPGLTRQINRLRHRRNLLFGAD
jgi:hypothetical protein